ncbi:MAG: serine/threonine protein kinase [Acidobacteria bacterium]|nr:serine/threonine protein kinase [Acidobacteriota bacterium]
MAGPSLEGRRIGAYRVLHPIGRGGMGTVYLAERVDQYRQRVALKVMSNDRFGGELQERFRRERQILARLTHPNIAQILDGGVTEDGRPFLVMQYVDGRPITEHCDAEGLGIRERLEVFRAVCEAVHFAHRNLVVHRDLKPSNILVGADGQVTLLDFGIAKLLDPEDESSAAAGATTSAELRMLTPEHAAPEQVLDLAVTTATDTWALGVLLYELLTGTRPFAAGGSRLELEREIVETDPPPPSVAALRTPRDGASSGALRTWSRSLRGDLDTIVRHALRKEPEARYASAEQLSDDIHRHLLGLPVRVRPDTFRYRAGRFLRRHPWQTAAALAFALLLAVFVVSAALQSRALERQRDAARVERDASERVTQVLAGLFRTTDPRVNPEIRSMTLDQILEAQSEKAVQDLEGQDEVQARLERILARAHLARGQTGRGRELLRKALARRRRIAGWRDGEALTTLHELATLEAREGNTVLAKRLLRHSLDLHRAVYGEEHPAVVQCLEDLARALPANSQAPTR